MSITVKNVPNGTSDALTPSRLHIGCSTYHISKCNSLRDDKSFDSEKLFLVGIAVLLDLPSSRHQKHLLQLKVSCQLYGRSKPNTVAARFPKCPRSCCQHSSSAVYANDHSHVRSMRIGITIPSIIGCLMQYSRYVTAYRSQVRELTGRWPI